MPHLFYILIACYPSANVDACVVNTNDDLDQDISVPPTSRLMVELRRHALTAGDSLVIRISLVTIARPLASWSQQSGTAHRHHRQGTSHRQVDNCGTYDMAWVLVAPSSFFKHWYARRSILRRVSTRRLWHGALFLSKYVSSHDDKNVVRLPFATKMSSPHSWFTHLVCTVFHYNSGVIFAVKYCILASTEHRWNSIYVFCLQPGPKGTQ